MLKALRYILVFALLALAVFAAFGAIGAAAQCAMCRASVSGANNATFIRNLNIGVLVLLVPPVTIFCSIFVVLKKFGRRDD